MKIHFLSAIPAIFISFSVLAAEPISKSPIENNMRPPLRPPQPAYYENGRPVYINLKPRRRHCAANEIYNINLKRCESSIKTTN